MTPEVILLIAVLSVAALSKLTVRDYPRILTDSAAGGLTRLLPARLVWFGIVLTELATAVLLVVTDTAGRLVTVGFFAGGVFYTAWALRYRPGVGCGCLGGGAPTTWKTVARTSLMLLVALVSLSIPGGGATWVNVLVAAAAAVAFVSLSPELRSAAILSRLRAIRYPRCLTSVESLRWATERIQETDAWRLVEARLLDKSSDDHWRESCWRMVSFKASWEGRASTAVFAVKLPPGEQFVRLAVVDDTTEEVVLALLERPPGRLRRNRRVTDMTPTRAADAAPELAMA